MLLLSWCSQLPVLAFAAMCSILASVTLSFLLFLSLLLLQCSSADCDTTCHVWWWWCPIRLFLFSFCSGLCNVSGCENGEHFTVPATEPAYKVTRMHQFGSHLQRGTRLLWDLANGIYLVTARTLFQWECPGSFYYSCRTEKLVSSQRRCGHVLIVVQYTFG